MKNKILLLISFTLFFNYSFCQKKIKPNLDIITYMGRTPDKMESNSLADNLIRILYYKIQPKSNLKIGYMNTKGQVLIKPKFNIGSDFYGNYANIIKDSVYGYIDKKGNEVLFKEYDKVFFYYGDTGIAKKNKQYGLINRNGDSLTPFKYTMINLFGSKHFNARTKNKTSEILNQNGNIVFDKDLKRNIQSYYFEADSSFIYQEVIDGKKLKGLVSLKGKTILSPKYEEIYFINDNDFYAVKNNKKWGYINKFGQEIIPLIYDKVSFNINNNLIPVKKNGKMGFINRENEIKIPFIYDETYAFTNNLAFVKKGEFYGCINKKNKVKINFNLEKTKFPFFANKLLLFKKGKKYGFLNKKGNIKILPIYDKAYPFINGLAYVELNGKVGYINKKGKEVIPIKYTQLWFESEGIIKFAK